MLKLDKEDQEFRNPLMFHGDPKRVDLNRVLLNLFMLIKYDGQRPKARVGRKEVTPETFVKRLIERESEGVVSGFSEHEEQVRWWVMTSLVDLVNRGNPQKEAVASLRAIHLNSYKFRNPRHSRDYNVAEQVYSMLQEAPNDLIKELKAFLSEGVDFGDKIQASETLDLDTLGVLRLVEGAKDYAGDEQFRPARSALRGQARIFADDVRRLLVYKRYVPRHVLLEYLRNIMGLHLGLYLLKLCKSLPRWVAQGAKAPECNLCNACSAGDSVDNRCPFNVEFVVDCGDDPSSAIARLSEGDATQWYSRLHDYIRATFAINMSLQFLGKRQKRKSEDLEEALQAMKRTDAYWNQYFRVRFEKLFAGLEEGSEELEEVKSVFRPVLDLNLPNFETFIELIVQARAGFHLGYCKELLDSLFQRNKETGLVWGGRSRKYGRRFWLSSRLLETLIQLAVLRVKDTGNEKRIYYSEPILIDTFLNWLKDRYGFIINGVDHERFRSSDVSVHQGFMQNVVHLKERLREIGFFTALSDAYVLQQIRPRYAINVEEKS